MAVWLMVYGRDHLGIDISFYQVQYRTPLLGKHFGGSPFRIMAVMGVENYIS